MLVTRALMHMDAVRVQPALYCTEYVHVTASAHVNKLSGMNHCVNWRPLFLVLFLRNGRLLKVLRTPAALHQPTRPLESK